MAVPKDDNGFPVAYGVSHLDGITPVAIKFNSSTRLIEVDSVTAIAFDPAIVASQTNNDFPLMKGTSSSDDATVLPVVVNATTGAVLIAT